MVVFDLSSSPGVAGLSPSRSTAHKALCCVLEQDIVSSASQELDVNMFSVLVYPLRSKGKDGHSAAAHIVSG